MASRKQLITLGIAVASAVLAIFVPILMALPLFVVAAHTGRSDLNTPARPVIMMLTDSENRPLAIPRPIDLAQTEHRGVVRTLSPQQRRELLGRRFPELA